MAVFVPADDFDLEDFIDDLSRELADRYRDAEDELIQQLARRVYRDLELQRLHPDTVVAGGLTAVERREQNRILGELAVYRARAIRELQTLAVQIADRLKPAELAAELVDTATRFGEAEAAARLGLAKRTPTVGAPMRWLGGAATNVYTLNPTAAQATGMIALSLQSRLEVLNLRLTRYPQDAYQRIVALSTPSTVLGVQTSLQQQQQIVRRFLSEGIEAFVDRGGRRWRFGSYAEMAGRTTVNRAFNDAGIWRMQSAGVNLVSITGGFDACKRCAPWIGKILSTDGSPAGWRTLPSATGDAPVTFYVSGTIEQAKNAGWNHPNCRDKAVAFLPGVGVPQKDFEYNAQAEKERERQRALERSIRSAKRDAATAPDDVARRRAEREVRDLQSQMRDFLEQTGRARQNWREQLHFADGK